MKALREAGHPVLEFAIPNVYEIGAEMYRWEIATVVACSILGVNAFDQPNVKASKKYHKGKDCRISKEWQLKEGKSAGTVMAVRIFSSSSVSGENVGNCIGKFFERAQIQADILRSTPICRVMLK